MSLSIDKVCRTCMEEAPTMLSLFDTAYVSVSPDSPSILHKLGTFTALPIIPNDGLPENICVSCIGSLNEAYNFKQKIEFSEAKLKMYLDQIAVKHEQIILSPGDVAEENYVIRCGKCNLIFKPDIFESHLETHNNIREDIVFLETNMEDESLPSSPQQIEYLNSDTNEDNKTEDCENEDNGCMTTVIEAIGGFSEEEDNTEACDEDIEDNTCSSIENEPSNPKVVKVKKQKAHKTGSISSMILECSKCSAKFSRDDLLQRHISINDCSKVLECEICKKVYCRISNLSEHLLKVHEKKIKCTKCLEEFDSLIVFNSHSKLHSDQVNSDAILDSTSDIRDDENQNETSEDLCKCIKCNATFPNKGLLKNHQIENTCTQCEICFKILKNKFHLVQHLKRMHKQKIKCSECRQEFTRLRDLRKHMATHRPKTSQVKPPKKPNLKPGLCPICGKKISGVGGLTVHMRRHNNIKPYKCSACDAAFVSNYDMKHHYRIHTGEAPYICEFCGYGFKSSSERTQHRRTHTGEKRHECEVCKQRFTALNTLKMHRKTHTGERPYACSICERKFARRDDMKKHVKVVHLGVKPHTCTICGEAFRQSNTLKTHMKSHDVLDSTVLQAACTSISTENNSDVHQMQE